MIPMLMKMKLPGRRNGTITLYLPLFIAWLILIPVLILLLPFILLAALLTWRSGYGRFILNLYPLLFTVMWYLQGLQIDISKKFEKIYFSFN